MKKFPVFSLMIREFDAESRSHQTASADDVNDHERRHGDNRSPGCLELGRALPTNYYPQEVISAALWKEWDGSDEGRARFERIHRSVGVRGRHRARSIPYCDLMRHDVVHLNKDFQ
jgi:hypothetical protein